ncbi:hypothetical protein M8J76_011963 [Diaphorina citri]|nr:hypothetical protein M8J76_011963 [Diaphorina citri]
MLSSQLIGTEPLKDQKEEPEVNDGDFELIRKIRSLAGLGYDALYGEHAYTRQKGINDLSVPLPTRKLFYAYDLESSDDVRDEDVDVDEVKEDEPLVDTAVANRLLDECEKLIEIYRPTNPEKADTEDMWEDIIPKSNWSPVHFKSFTQLMKILNNDRLSRLSHVGHSSEAILRRVTIEQTASRLRKLFTSIGWNLKMAQWLHGLLVDRAPVKVLVCYLEAMQVLYAKIPSLVNQVINLSSASLSSKNLGIDIITQIITKKSWDPVAPMLSQHKMPKLHLAPVFIVLGSEPLHDLPQNSRTHHWISLLTELGSVIPITSLQTEQDKNRMKIAIYLDELLYTVRYRIHQARAEFESSKRPIILVGFNAGSSLMAHAALYESVAGVVCIGFSVDTVEGRRGEVGDRILEVKCPMMFVIGQCATTASEADMEQLRSRLQCISGLIVVGGGDDQMRKSKLDLMQERVTQDIVDRAVINEVGAFLSKALTMPPPSRPTPPVTTTSTSTSTGNGEVVKIKDEKASKKEERALKKEEKAAKKEARERERGAKKNYYQERKRKMAELKANAPKKQKLSLKENSKTPQLIMVSTAPTILRTSTLNQLSKVKKSDTSPRKSVEELSPPLSAVPQITIVSKTPPSTTSTILPPPLTKTIARITPSTSVSSPVKITSISSPAAKIAATVSSPVKIASSPVKIAPPSSSSLAKILSGSTVKIPSSTSILPSSSKSAQPPPVVTSASVSLSVLKSGNTTSSTAGAGGSYISLQSLLKSHQSSRPVPLSQVKKGGAVLSSVQSVPSPQPPQSGNTVITSMKPHNIRVIGKASKPRTFNLSTLTNVRFLTSTPTSTPSSNLLRDLTPAQLLDAPIDIMDDSEEDVIPLETTVVNATPRKIPPQQSVKLIRINKSGINVSGGNTPVAQYPKVKYS